METEVPAVIPKEQRKQAPNQQNFDKAMKDLDSQIENLRAKIVSLRAIKFYRGRLEQRRLKSFREAKSRERMSPTKNT